MIFFQVANNYQHIITLYYVSNSFFYNVMKNWYIGQSGCPSALLVST